MDAAAAAKAARREAKRVRSVSVLSAEERRDRPAPAFVFDAPDNYRPAHMHPEWASPYYHHNNNVQPPAAEARYATLAQLHGMPPYCFRNSLRVTQPRILDMPTTAERAVVSLAFMSAPRPVIMVVGTTTSQEIVIDEQARLLIFPRLDPAADPSSLRCTEIPIVRFWWGDQRLTGKQAMDCMEQNADALKVRPIDLTFHQAPNRCNLLLGRCNYLAHGPADLRCICECPPNDTLQALLQTSDYNPNLEEFAKMVRRHDSPYRGLLDAHLLPKKS